MKKENKQDSIRYLFEPRGVAVIGASGTKGKIGHALCHNILEGGYKGKLFPINPKGGTILGQKVYKDIVDVPDVVDVAAIAVPAKYVAIAVEHCGKKGVKYLLVVTSGFSEIGNNKEEKKIVAIARDYGMRVLGPNIFGLYFDITLIYQIYNLIIISIIFFYLSH